MTSILANDHSQLTASVTNWSGEAILDFGFFKDCTAAWSSESIQDLCRKLVWHTIDSSQLILCWYELLPQPSLPEAPEPQ